MISGLDALSRQFDELGKAAKALDGDIATVNFDPGDPASIRAAVREMERAIDSKVSRWRTNPLVADLARQTKTSMRDAIQRRARQIIAEN
jgi:hypothetical protein